VLTTIKPCLYSCKACLDLERPARPWLKANAMRHTCPMLFVKRMTGLDFYTWAARHNTWLLIKLTPKGVDFSFYFFYLTFCCGEMIVLTRWFHVLMARKLCPRKSSSFCRVVCPVRCQPKRCKYGMVFSIGIELLICKQGSQS